MAGAQPVVHGLQVSDFWATPNLVYVLSGSSIRRYALSGALATTILLPWTPAHDLVVDPAGDMYVLRAPFDVLKLGPAGNKIYLKHFKNRIQAIFGHQSPHGWRLGIVANGTHFLNAAGAVTGAAAVAGTHFSDAGSGALVADDGRYVTLYDRSYHRIFHFGDRHWQNDPMPESAPLHFYLQGGAVRLRNGSYLVADSGKGIWWVNAHGLINGFVPQTQLGGLTQSSRLEVVGSWLYMATGQPFSSAQAVSRAPISQVLAAAVAPSQAIDRLGFGAGAATGRPGNYYPWGSKPRIHVSFDSWWRQLRGLSLRYSVQYASQVQNEQRQKWHSVRLNGRRLAHGLELRMPGNLPGGYQTNIVLRQGKRAVSATCVHYGVGSPGDRLNMSRMPGTADAGGPDGARGIALADLMGTGGDRVSLDWRRLVTANGTLTFGYYDRYIAAAAAESRRTGVPFSVQLGAGKPESGYVADGTWQAKVLQVVRHFASQVNYWEAWNEPNVTGYSATDYVNKILKPVYQDVRIADPTAKVIGGTVVGIGSTNYWKQIAAAGGFNDMDIAGIHPYPGADRSLEEEGFANRFNIIKGIAAAAGKPNIPFWVTELAWWSNGPANWYGQANNSARAQLWFKAEGIPVWDYFIAESTWGNFNQDFSAIDANGGDVKPVMLALMAQHNILTNLPFQTWLPTGIPDTYAQQYGTRTGNRASVVALWSDDMNSGAVVHANRPAKLTAFNEYGARVNATITKRHPLVVPVNGSVLYLKAPAGVRLHVAPLESYGHDLALASSGARAWASSSNPLNPPAKAIDGIGNAEGQGDFRSSPAWASNVGDPHPALAVQLAKPHVIDRVIMATGGIDSVQTGIRGYDVQVARPHHQGWTTVASVRRNFYTRTVQSRFKPVKATAVRILVVSVNYSGYVGGAMPYFWPTDTKALTNSAQPWYGPAIIRELQVYAPGKRAGL